MNEVITFVKDNYVWFIVGGVLILMTIIGYIAEKKDYLHNKKDNNEEPKNNKKEEQVQMVTTPAEPAKVEEIKPAVQEQPKPLDANKVENSNINNVDLVNEDLTVPLTNSPTQENIMDDSIPAELMTPIEQVKPLSVSNEVEEPAPAVVPLTELNDNSQKENVVAEPTPVVESTTVAEPVQAVEPAIENAALDNTGVEPQTVIADAPAESTLNEDVFKTETTEIVDADISPAVDNTEFEKMFPEDPVIINESNKDESVEEKKDEEIPQEEIWNS